MKFVNKFLKSIVAITVFFTAFPSFSKIALKSNSTGAVKFDLKFGSDLPIKKGHLIEIHSYSKKTGTYVVSAVEFPGEGRSNVTKAALARAVGSIRSKGFESDVLGYVGNQYKLDRDLSTLFPAELKELEKK